MMHCLFRLVLQCCQWLLLLLVLMGALALLGLVVRRPLQERFVAELPGMLSASETAPWMMVVAMGLLLLVLMTLWMQALLWRRRSPMLTFNTVEGSVSIATVTLARFVRQVIQSSRGVVNAQVETAVDGRKMSVMTRVRFTDEQSTTQLATEVQRMVRLRVQDVFGCDLLRDIRIEVAGVDIRAGRTRRLLSWRAEAEPAPPPPVLTGT